MAQLSTSSDSLLPLSSSSVPSGLPVLRLFSQQWAQLNGKFTELAKRAARAAGLDATAVPEHARVGVKQGAPAVNALAKNAVV